MPQRGPAGARRYDRRDDGRGQASPGRLVAFDPDGEILAGDNRTATLAALADEFAARFGIDDSGPSAAALADRFGLRWEPPARGARGVATPFDPEPRRGPGAAGAPGAPAPTRRTVTITGRGTTRATAPAARTVRADGRRGAGAGVGRGLARAGAAGLRADRIALWAVGLGLLLAVIAVMSAHAA